MQGRLWSDGHKLPKSLLLFIKMKKKFSTTWKASKQPRKQRKYAANAPLHLRKKMLSVNLSKELKKKYGKRNIPVRKGDKVKILRGKFKKKQGKVNEVKLKISKVVIENIQIKKKDGSKVNVRLRPSNLQIIELNLEDKKRIEKLGLKKEETKTQKKDEKNRVESKPTPTKKIKKVSEEKK